MGVSVSVHVHVHVHHNLFALVSCVRACKFVYVVACGGFVLPIHGPFLLVGDNACVFTPLVPLPRLGRIHGCQIGPDACVKLAAALPSLPDLLDLQCVGSLSVVVVVVVQCGGLVPARAAV